MQNKKSYIDAKSTKIITDNPDAIAGFNLDLRINVWNQQAESVFGIPVIQALGMNILDIVSYTDRLTYDLDDFNKCLGGQTVTQNNISRKSLKKHWMILSSKLLPLFGEDGVIIGGFVIFRNCTKEFHEQRVLTEALKLAKMASWEISCERHLKFTSSDQLLTLLSLEEEEGKDFGMFVSQFEKSDAVALKKAIDHTMSSGDASTIDVKKNIGGEKKHYRISWEGERLERKTIRIFGIVQDISLDVRQKELLALQQVQLVSKNRMAALGELSAGVAHEVNNPLAIIKGFAAIFARTLDSDQPDLSYIKEKLTKVDDAIDRVSAIIASLQKFSQSTNEETLKDCQVKEIIATIAADMKEAAA